MVRFPPSTEKILMLTEYLATETDISEKAKIQKYIQETDNSLRTPSTCETLTELVSLRTEANVEDKFRSTVISDFMTKHVRIDMDGRSIGVDTLAVREIALHLSNMKKKSYYSDQTVGQREDGTTYIIDESPKLAIRHVVQHNTNDTTIGRTDVYVNGDTNSGKTIEIVAIAWFVFFVYGRFPVIVLQNYDGKNSRNDVEDNIKQLNNVIDAFLLEKANTFKDLHSEEVRKMYQLEVAQTSDSGTLEQWGETKTQLQEARVLITNAEISHAQKATQLVRNLMRRYRADDVLSNYMPFTLIQDESDAIPEQISKHRKPKTQGALEWLTNNAARIWQVSATLSKCVISYDELKRHMQHIVLDVPSNYYGTGGHGEYKLQKVKLAQTFETNPNLTGAICEVLNIDIVELEAELRKLRLKTQKTILPLKYGTAYIRNGKLAIRQPLANKRTDEQNAIAGQVQQRLQEKLSPEEIAWAANHENILEVSNKAIERSANCGLSVSLLILSNARICKAMDHVLKQIRDHEDIQQKLHSNRIQGVYLAINGGKDTESQTRSHVLYFWPPLTADALNNAEMKTLCEKMLCETAEDGRTIRVKSRFNYKNCLSIPYFLHKIVGCRVAVFLCGNSMVKRAANIRNVYPGDQEHHLDYELYVTDQLLECVFGATQGSTEAIQQSNRLKNILKSLMFGPPVLYGSCDVIDVIEEDEKSKRKTLNMLTRKTLWRKDDPERRSVYPTVYARLRNKKPFPLNKRGASKRRFATDQEDWSGEVKLQGKRRRRVAQPDSLDSALAAPSAPANRPIRTNMCLCPNIQDVMVCSIAVHEPDISEHYKTILTQLVQFGFTTRKTLEITTRLRNIQQNIKSFYNGDDISIPNTIPDVLHRRQGQGFFSGGIMNADMVGYSLTHDTSDQLTLHYCFIKREELFRLELVRSPRGRPTRSWQIVQALQRLHLSGIFGTSGTFNKAMLTKEAGLKTNNGNHKVVRALECWCDVLGRGRKGVMYQLKTKYAKLVDDMSRASRRSPDPRMHGYSAHDGFVTKDDDDEHVDGVYPPATESHRPRMYSSDSR